jgi:hypothetical protein
MASLRHPWFLRETSRYWPLMSAYWRFEHGVAFLLALPIALLALSRKFVVLEATGNEPALVAALAGATLVPGPVYWLLRERDDRLARDGLEPDGIE